jgi:hypothetical protein
LGVGTRVMQVLEIASNPSWVSKKLNTQFWYITIRIKNQMLGYYI